MATLGNVSSLPGLPAGTGDATLANPGPPRVDLRRLGRRTRRALTRGLFGALRRVAPVVQMPAPLQRFLQRRTFKRAGLPMPDALAPVVLVFDAQAVRQVLADYHAFPVRPLYGAKMRDTFGPFLLGLDYQEPADAGARTYQEQIALVRAAVGPAAAGPLIAAARRAAAAGIAAAPHGTIDLVAMMQTVMSHFLADYFGIPEIPGSDASLLTLNQRTASYVFNIEMLNADKRQPAIDAGRRIHQHLTALFRAKLAPDAARGDTFVDRMAAAAPSWTPEQLATVSGGTISGLLVPTTAQFLAVADHLLDLPAGDYDRLCATAQLRAALVARDSDDEDDGRLQRYVLEAARFEPFPTGLQRQCSAAASDQQRTLEIGDGRRTLLPPGATVLAMVGAANCDPRFAPRPGAFALARPDSQYMLFGTGQHHCVGATRHWPVAQTLMTELATALFSLPNLRRAPGARGTRYTPKGEQWPRHFDVVYEPGGAR